MKSSIKIMSNMGKWSNIKYVNSNARSRMSTKQLIQDHNNGKIDIVNPWMLEN